MNWTKSIRSILGRFWTWLFHDADFVLAVQNLHTLSGKEAEQILSNLLCINDIDNKTPTRTCIPKPLLLDIGSIHRSYFTLDEVLAQGSTKQLGKEDATKDEWVGVLTSPADTPYMISSHVLGGFASSLFEGVDFKCKNNEILLWTNPATLGLTKLKLITDDGLKFYYVLWAWYAQNTPDKDAVTGLIAQGSGKYSEAMWKIRHECATETNIKELLALASSSVVSRTAGTISAIWTEQDYTHIQIGDDIYSAPVSYTRKVNEGDEVSVGDILFGNLIFCGPDTMPSYEDVPGIRVSTDVGSLIAKNEVSTVEDNILPLQGNEGVLEAYKTEATIRNEDTRCPYVELTPEMNVLQYIHQTVRKGRSYISVVEAENITDINPAIKALRENTCASAIVSLIVKTNAETYDPLELEATATAGNGAIATCVTPLIASNSVETEVWQ